MKGKTLLNKKPLYAICILWITMTFQFCTQRPIAVVPHHEITKDTKAADKPPNSSVTQKNTTHASSETSEILHSGSMCINSQLIQDIQLPIRPGRIQLIADGAEEAVYKACQLKDFKIEKDKQLYTAYFDLKIGEAPAADHPLSGKITEILIHPNKKSLVAGAYSLSFAVYDTAKKESQPVQCDFNVIVAEVMNISCTLAPTDGKVQVGQPVTATIKIEQYATDKSKEYYLEAITATSNSDKVSLDKELGLAVAAYTGLAQGSFKEALKAIVFTPKACTQGKTYEITFKVKHQTDSDSKTTDAKKITINVAPIEIKAETLASTSAQVAEVTVTATGAETAELQKLKIQNVRVTETGKNNDVSCNFKIQVQDAALDLKNGNALAGEATKIIVTANSAGSRKECAYTLTFDVGDAGTILQKDLTANFSIKIDEEETKKPGTPGSKLPNDDAEKEEPVLDDDEWAIL